FHAVGVHPQSNAGRPPRGKGAAALRRTGSDRAAGGERNVEAGAVPSPQIPRSSGFVRPLPAHAQGDGGSARGDGRHREIPVVPRPQKNDEPEGESFRWMIALTDS